MANYIATTRSNYFRVKDRADFEEWAGMLDVRVYAKHNDPDLVFIAAENDDGGWPTMALVGDYDEDIDFVAELADHLAEGEIAVLIETGAEALRYLCGRATAVRSDGARVDLALDEIYDRAKAAFGREPGRAEW